MILTYYDESYELVDDIDECTACDNTGLAIYGTEDGEE